MTVQFIRSTHDNGRFRHFPPEANQFWRRYGTVVGALLRLETPLSFADLMILCREYALEQVGAGPIPELHESYVAWVLIHLIEYGMVTAVAMPPTPPSPGPGGPRVVYHIRRHPHGQEDKQEPPQ